ncbi:MAG: alpha/beta fold hydrolase, partial [Bdellovibrionales bacterium]|nr:alpha/beta fold hydrolase [Bdellovibrionales bacterium]
MSLGITVFICLLFIGGLKSIASPSIVSHDPILIPISSEIKLNGFLTVPKDNRKSYSAVLLLEGSGKASETKETHSSAYRQIAEKLAEAGMASLRFNKRGTGYNQNRGSFKFASFSDNYKDALSALEFLKRQPKIDSRRIFVLGQSMGGIRATRLAVENPDILGLILVATPTRPYEDFNNEQLEFFLRFQGLGQIDISKELEKNRFKNASLKNGTFNCSDYVEVCEVDEKTGEALLEGQSLRYWKEVVQVNQVEALSLLSVPTLVVHGTSDWVVSVKDAALSAVTLEKSDTVKFQVNIIPNFDHFFVTNGSK